MRRLFLLLMVCLFVEGMFAQSTKKIKEITDKYGFEIDFTEKLLDIIVEYGYDQIFGARPLKRAIQNIVENKLAHIVLNGGLMPEKKQFIDFDEQKEEIVVI